MRFTDMLKYHGKVTIKTETSSGKIIATNVYKNAGTKYLAKFLCYCIAGNYEIIDSKRPFRIGLFFNNAPSPDTATEGTLYPLAPIYISINKVADISPILDATHSTEITNYKVVLHFLIPYSYISIPADPSLNINGINQICLYDKTTTQDSSISANYRDYSASFLLTRRNEEEGANEWNPIEITETGNNSYNLTIDWEMTFDVEK